MITARNSSGRIVGLSRRIDLDRDLAGKIAVTAKRDMASLAGHDVGGLGAGSGDPSELPQAAHVPATEPHPMVSTQRIVVFAAGHTKEATPSSGLAPPCPHAMLLGS